ncbi:hypothetical protein VTJ83DRAFT_6881 [Remersonia thermophila]|uniref:Putative lipoate-protein ligase A n=1 Tax=Remersonia thermophila TaxID=72144 RepID=A0ABR4D5Z7_9PEZI
MSFLGRRGPSPAGAPAMSRRLMSFSSSSSSSSSTSSQRCLLRSSLLRSSLLRSSHPTRHHVISPRIPSRASPRRHFTQHLHRPVQVYRSTSADPYINLSIEHHLLQRSHPGSTILFLYTNRPCIVIGRNQNPWLEVNLRALADGLPPAPAHASSGRACHGPISLVRRRSGGGAVFHDHGNANWSIICPPAIFTRDLHADMVARALRERLGVPTARVNERHDIVIDAVADADADATNKTFKVSGSAYKLTRTRALHHGTCLLSSPNLARVGRLLRSPAEGFIKARGVESVRSPIRNVGADGDAFAEAVLAEFRAMYGRDRPGDAEEVVVTEEQALANHDVVAGVRELASAEWIFGQTPLFTFSTEPTDEDPRPRPAVGHALPPGFRAHLVARHGEIQSVDIRGLSGAEADATALAAALVRQRLHHISDWRRALDEAGRGPVDPGVGEFLNEMLGIRSSADASSASVAQMVEHIISDTPLGRFLAEAKQHDG